MQIYPAIDLMDRSVVRLEEGKKESKKVYGPPLEFAKRFARHVDKVHVVDLDGAFTGTPANLEIVRRIIDETDLKVQFGGGIRTLEVLRAVKEAGVTNPVVGTKARDLEFLERASREFEGLTVSLDVGRDGLMVEGWKESTSVSPREAFSKLKNYVGRFVFTATSRDGKLEGIKKVERFWGNQEVIYAGGVTTLEDLNRLNKWGFNGAIVGKAIYEGKLELERAVASAGEEYAS